MSIAPKVVFISTMGGDPWGGSEELWSEAALRLIAEGYKVAAHVKKWDTEAPQIQKLRALGARIFYHSRSTIPQRVMRRLNLNGSYAWLDRFKPDLVVISQAVNWDGFAHAQACIERKFPYIMVAQAASPGYFPNDGILSRVQSAFREAAACYFVSEANRELTEIQIADRLTSFEVIRNPFRMSFVQPLPWPPEGFRMACVAALDPARKGQDLLFWRFEGRRGITGRLNWRCMERVSLNSDYVAWPPPASSV